MAEFGRLTNHGAIPEDRGARTWSGEPLQPHERADRPPFWATHEWTFRIQKLTGWVEEIHFQFMVIEGLAYTRSAWEDGSRPWFDVDGHGVWWDLEKDCAIDPNKQPTPLPGRYVGWQDGSGEIRMLAVEPTGVRVTDVKPPAAFWPRRRPA